jgi:hypothetical protein
VYACGRIGVTAYGVSAKTLEPRVHSEPLGFQIYEIRKIDLRNFKRGIIGALRRYAVTPTRRYGSPGSWLLTDY